VQAAALGTQAEATLQVQTEHIVLPQQDIQIQALVHTTTQHQQILLPQQAIQAHAQIAHIEHNFQIPQDWPSQSCGKVSQVTPNF